MANQPGPAGAQPPPPPPPAQPQAQPELDGRCDYENFRKLPEGKIACLGVGKDTPAILLNGAKAEITCMAFQKVDTGTVKALLPNTDFTPVDWPNSPFRARPPIQVNPQPGQRIPVQFLHNELLLPPPNNVQPQWQEFTDVMRHVKRAMLARMTPPNNIVPDSLLSGFGGEFWRGARHNSLKSSGSMQMTAHIEADMGHHWVDNDFLEDWISRLCNGLYNAVAEFKNLFSRFLFRNCNVKNQQEIVVSPSETSRNGTLADGVVHCLTYGFHNDQMVPRRARARGFHQRPLSHRVLLPKRLGSRSRSRSRSPVSSDDEAEQLLESVEDRANPRYQPQFMNELIDDPDKYVLKPQKFHSYFESHRPDLLLYEVINLADYVVKAKIVVEVCSYKKNNKGVSLITHLEYNTFQLVQSCLSALSVDQDLLYGILVVVDGLKLIKIEREQNQAGTFQYLISETDLAMWDDSDSLKSMFEMINGIL